MGIPMARETHEARKVQMNRGTRCVARLNTCNVKPTEFIAYWLAIYSGIALVDHFVFRRGFDGYRPEDYDNLARETHEARKVQMNRGTRCVARLNTCNVKPTE
jgi:hypothetical protein